MRLSLLAALVGLVGATSNVTYWGAPRLSLGETLPNLDASGHVEVADTLQGISPPSCGKDDGSASKGNSIAYYQAWNVRTRPCDKIWPSQINTAGLTHLVSNISTQIACETFIDFVHQLLEPCICISRPQDVQNSPPERGR
jgi:hypothetical protein